MANAIDLARRVASAPADEWRHRLRQARFTLRGWLASGAGHSALPPLGAWRSLGVARDDLPAWWAARESRWFLDEERVRALTRGAQAGGPLRRGVIDRADLVVAGRMPLFSHPPVDFGRRDRWRRDPILERTAPDRFYAGIRSLDASQVGDSKHVWEPNRWAWALWLGVAHRTLDDPRHARKFVELASDWFAANRYPIGVNYCSALEVALRAYAWLWALHLFEDVLVRERSLLASLLEGIWVACRHVEENLSTYFSPNTHLVGEAFALFACGASLGEFAEAERWRGLGLDILAREAERQLHEDGTHRELSSGYHLYCADFYLQAALIAEQTSLARDERIPAAARKLCDRLAELAPPDLVLPQFNDCDGGRLLSLCEEPLDAAPTLFAAASLWDDFAFEPGRRSACGYALLMGRPEKSDATSERAIPSPNPRPKPARAAPLRASERCDSGIAAYRNASGDYLLFRATPFGYLDCPHSHDAPLSFLLQLGHQSIVVDNGVGSYTQDLALRDEFRSARGKSVLLLDGRGPSEPDGWFSWKRRTDALLSASERIAGGYRCRGRHEGFSDASRGRVVVEREITLLDEGSVTIVDHWDATQPVSVRTSLTLDPRLEVDLGAGLLRSPSGMDVHFHHTPADATISVVRIPYSPDYGLVGETSALLCDVGSSRSGSCTTVVSRAGEVPAPVAAKKQGP